MPIDPNLLESLGIYDPGQQQLLSDQVDQIASQAPPSPAPSTTPVYTPTPINQQDALARLQGVLNQYDLGSLSDWAWGQLTAGVTENQILVSMHDQPQYQQRFPYEQAMRDAGLPVLSPAEMLKMETDYKQVQRAFGVQPSVNPSDYVNLFTNQVSANEFNSRLDTYNKLRTTYAPYIKQQFEDQAGITGIKDEDLYNLLSGQDQGLAQKYADNTGTPLHLPSFSDIQTAEQKALEAQKANFSNQGGVVQTVNPADLEKNRELAI